MKSTAFQQKAKEFLPSQNTRQQRKIVKEKQILQKDISMDKITHNLKQTELALREFQNTFKNLTCSSSDRKELKTAESSTSSNPASSSKNILKNKLQENTDIFLQEEKLFKFNTFAVDTINEEGNSKLENQIANLKERYQRMQILDSEDQQSIENEGEQSTNEQESQNLSDRELSSLNKSCTPSICSEQEVNTQQTSSQKSFNYNQNFHIEKENFHPNINQNDILKIVNKSTPKLVSESFRCYLDNMNSNNSQAIAGAMRALQKKIKSLEQENTILKECFQGVQNKCVDLEKAYEIEKQQQILIQQNSSRSQLLTSDIETLQQQIENLRNSQCQTQEIKQKYKKKVQKLQEDIRNQKLKFQQQETKFNEQRSEYQQERQSMISQLKSLEQQNKELVQSQKNAQEQIAKLKQENDQLQGREKGKLKKYKKHIHQLRRELKMLEQSHQVSQKALKHTEHFVDEVVYVNEKLVHNLSKSKIKLRSLSCSQSRRKNSNSEETIFQDTLNIQDNQNYRRSSRRQSVQGHAQNSIFKTYQEYPNDQVDLINRNEISRHEHIQVPSTQITAQKPPMSTRNMHRCFSFSRTHEKPLQPQIMRNSQQQMIKQTPSQIKETSRFQDDDSILNNSSIERIGAHNYQSNYTSNAQILIDDKFSLKPYEKQIDNVTLKIEKIEKELEALGIQCQTQRSNEKYFENKQSELLSLKKEHEQLKKQIRERSHSRSINQ